jgi:hypothetical protein
MMLPEFDFTARRAELETELAEALAELPGLRAAEQAAQEAAGNAVYRLELFCQRFAAATRHGADEAGPGLRELLEEERQARRTADAAANLARRHRENAEWKIACLRTDLDQIARLTTPLPLVHRPEIIRTRPKPSFADHEDIIVMPPGTQPAAA